MKLLPFVLTVAVAACAVSEAKVRPQVTVELAAVTLADDCPTPRRPMPAASAKRKAPVPAAADASAPAGLVAPSADQSEEQRMGCEQTSMQLSLKLPAGARPTSVRIKRVELVDARGKVVQVLTARTPTRWTEQGAYAPWNQRLAAGQVVTASYALSAPNWNKLTNGRMAASAQVFTLRVTVATGTGQLTVEHAASARAYVEPNVVT